MRTLVVEDDAINREVLKGFLSPYGEVALAENGWEGLKLFKEAFAAKKRFDLICLDIMMPEMNGQVTLAEMRKFEKENNIGWSSRAKIIMVTALTDPENIRNAFMIGHCEAYLTKPVDRFQLMEQIAKLGLLSSSATHF